VLAAPITSHTHTEHLKKTLAFYVQMTQEEVTT